MTESLSSLVRFLTQAEMTDANYRGRQELEVDATAAAKRAAKLASVWIT